MKEKGSFDLQDYRDLEHLELYARQVVEGFITGLHKSPYHGFSVEFSEHRIYNPGESTRNIDWKLYARTDRLYTKRYEEETNLRCHLLLDTSGSMFYPLDRLWDNKKPNKFLFSAVSALAIFQLMRRQRDAMGLQTFGGREIQTPTRSTYQHLKAVSMELAGLIEQYQVKTYEGGRSMAEMLHIIAERIHKRSLVLIFSDLFEMQENEEAVWDALQHLKYNRHEVIIFRTHDRKTEGDFEFEERPYRFVDMESGESIKLNPAEIKERYQREMVDFQRRLSMKCLQYKIELVVADVAAGYYPVLQNYLIKRQKLY